MPRADKIWSGYSSRSSLFWGYSILFYMHFSCLSCLALKELHVSRACAPTCSLGSSLIIFSSFLFFSFLGLYKGQPIPLMWYLLILFFVLEHKH